MSKKTKRKRRNTTRALVRKVITGQRLNAVERVYLGVNVQRAIEETARESAKGAKDGKERDRAADNT